MQFEEDHDKKLGLNRLYKTVKKLTVKTKNLVKQLINYVITLH